ncbi:hypothetical protein GpartN1_g6180.t1 [Galdieria partita]|uniref:t-SNARE coiled-coil homology domain-containing protein n=1 Tax=Galdieria partita TaxID=83374 RepID=A0A9C7Q226_9RHOD|nr:hypothetical protein GpartN1_g6180.t1 [Galdieria partita]
MADEQTTHLQLGCYSTAFYQRKQDEDRNKVKICTSHSEETSDYTLSTANNVTSSFWEAQTLQIAKQGTESAKRARKMAEEARLIGILTAEDLGKQTEQLETIQDDVEAVHSNLEDAEHIIHDMEGGFFGELVPFRKPVKTYKRTSAPVENRTVEEAKKGISGIDIDGLKAGKTDTNSTWTVIKNQERRKKQEEEKKERETSFKNPLKYLWNWWSGNDSILEKKVQDRERTQQCSIDEGHLQTDLCEKSILESLSPSVDKYIRKQDMELDRIGSALKDMKEIAFRMNEELSYQEHMIENLQVNVEDAGYRLHGDLRRVKRI